MGCVLSDFCKDLLQTPLLHGKYVGCLFCTWGHTNYLFTCRRCGFLSNTGFLVGNMTENTVKRIHISADFCRKCFLLDTFWNENSEETTSAFPSIISMVPAFEVYSLWNSEHFTEYSLRRKPAGVYRSVHLLNSEFSDVYIYRSLMFFFQVSKLIIHFFLYFSRFQWSA